MNTHVNSFPDSTVCKNCLLSENVAGYLHPDAYYCKNDCTAQSAECFENRIIYVDIDCPICGSPLSSDCFCDECNRTFKDEVYANIVEETLTDAQLGQQDSVDNLLTELIQNFKPDFQYDGEIVAAVRDGLIDALTKLNMPEYDIYPWLLESNKDKELVL